LPEQEHNWYVETRGTGKVLVLTFTEESRMIRRRGRVAAHRTRVAEATAKPASAAADGLSRTTAVVTRPGSLFRGREPTAREIRDRAYFIYLARGGANGDAVADWVRAERELREELGGNAPGVRRF
jgi:hypothetical protein